jgi:hypothetical protein
MINGNITNIYFITKRPACTLKGYNYTLNKTQKVVQTLRLSESSIACDSHPLI